MQYLYMKLMGIQYPTPVSQIYLLTVTLLYICILWLIFMELSTVYCLITLEE